MKWPNGNTFHGDFCEGSLDGHGKMIYANGDVYDGNWEHGSRNGKGTLVYFLSREKYEGEWMEDKRSGEGLLKNAKGDVIKTGYWSNNEIVV
jgi:hypothetical protein